MHHIFFGRNFEVFISLVLKGKKLYFKQHKIRLSEIACALDLTLNEISQRESMLISLKMGELSRSQVFGPYACKIGAGLT